MKPIKPGKSKSPLQKETLPAINSKKEKSPKDSRSQSPVPGNKNQSKTSKDTKEVPPIKEEPKIAIPPPKEAVNEKGKKDPKKVQEDFKKRLKLEKEQEKKDRELFEKILAEAKSNNFKSHSMRTTIENQPPPIRITEKKAQSILENGGMLDAYKYVIACLCKNGLPTGNLFEYAAYIVQGYEKKWKEKKSKETKKKLEEYWNNKEIEMLGKLNDEGEKGKLNRSLEERELKKYIRTLDRSRSSKRIREPRSLSRTKDLEKLNLLRDSQKQIVNIQQQNNERLETSGSKSPKLTEKNNNNNKDALNSSLNKSLKGNTSKEKEPINKKGKEPPTGKKAEAPTKGKTTKK